MQFKFLIVLGVIKRFMVFNFFKKRRGLTILSVLSFMFGAGFIFVAEVDAAGPDVALTAVSPVLGLLSWVFGKELNVAGLAAWLASLPAIVMQYLAQFVIFLGALLTENAIKLNEGVMTSDFISKAYPILLSIANLLLVILLIIIAISTILRVKQFQAKSMLWKVILLAFLINFGLAIAGVFIDAANIFGQYFLSGFTGTNGTGIKEAIVNTFNPQQLSVGDPGGIMKQAAEENEASGSFFGTILVVVMPQYAIAFLLLLVAVVILAVALVLLVRYLYLLVLLAFLPLAWVAVYFPILGAQVKNWWDKFLNWVFVFPVLAFFIWLTANVLIVRPEELAADKDAKTATMKIIAQGSLSSIDIPISPEFEYIKGQEGVIDRLIQMGSMTLGAAAFLIAGLMAAVSMGAKVAGAGLAAADKIKATALGVATAPGKAAGRLAWQNEKMRGMREGAGKWLMKTGTAGRLLGLQKLGLATYGGVQGDRAKDLEAANKKLAGKPPEIQEKLAHTAAEKAQLVMNKIAKGQFDASKTDDQNLLKSANVKAYGLDKEIEKTDPHLRQYYDQAGYSEWINQTVSKATQSQISQFSPEAIKSLLAAGSPVQPQYQNVVIDAISRSGNQAQKTEVAGSLANMMAGKGNGFVARVNSNSDPDLTADYSDYAGQYLSRQQIGSASDADLKNMMAKLTKLFGELGQDINSLPGVLKSPAARTKFFADLQRKDASGKPIVDSLLVSDVENNLLPNAMRVLSAARKRGMA